MESANDILPSIPRTEWHGGYDKIEFEVGGATATVVCPAEPLDGRLWAWKGEFLDAFPGTELALLERGVYIVAVGVPDQFGGPIAMRVWERLYKRLTQEEGFAAKSALIGLSRGGLYCYQWAIRHPDRVACLFGDAPVCDMNSWPGGFGEGEGSPDEWEKMKAAFGFASDDEARAYAGQPVDNLEPLARAGIPILHVFGDADLSVPWRENTGRVSQRYQELGGSIRLIAKRGGAHHPHGLDDPQPIVDFILKHLPAQQDAQSRAVG